MFQLYFPRLLNFRTHFPAGSKPGPGKETTQYGIRWCRFRSRSSQWQPYQLKCPKYWTRESA